MQNADRISEQIEMLPGEHVVWEGGASSKGITVALLHSVAVLLVCFACICIFTFSQYFYYEDNPNYIEEPVQLSDSSEGQNTESAKKEPRRIINSARAITYWILVLLAALGAAVYGLSKTIKNYWLVATNERICIRSGVFNRNVVTIDLDKVTSIRKFDGPVERLFGLHSLEVQHAGTLHNNHGLSLFNPYTIRYLENSEQLSNAVLNNWLPRDNVRSRRTEH